MAAVPHNALRLRRLTLTAFRNYADLRIEVERPVAVLHGPNGAGKTNLLEAISLLAPGRGLRGAAFADLLRRDGGTAWAVAGEVEGPSGPATLGTAWQAGGDAEDANGQGRSVRIDGRAEKGSGALGTHMRLLWLTPAMDRLFAGPAGDRRRFLDRLVMAFDPAHGSRVLAFEKLLRERNRLLAERPSEASWLDGVERQAAEAGVAVAAARLAAVAALSGHLERGREVGGETGFPWAAIAVEGEIEARLGVGPALQVEDHYRRLLRASRAIDQRAGRTCVGPHRSDLLVTHGPKGVEARLCSTGEQKALLIGMVLAHARAVRAEFEGWAPILLLDEVAAHLDEERRIGLFAEIERIGGQAWMSGTDLAAFAPLGTRADYLSVKDGRVLSQSDV